MGKISELINNEALIDLLDVLVAVMILKQPNIVRWRRVWRSAERSVLVMAMLENPVLGVCVYKFHS